jgi:hypothetical protein
MTCRPGHAPKWPDFEPGNVVALRHGAYSDQVIEQRAELVRHQLFDLAPWLAQDPTFVVAVARFVRVEARSQLLAEAIATKAEKSGILSVGARMLEAATSTDRLAAKLGDDLGLSPLGKARLKALTAAGEVGAATLADLAEQGRQARQRSQAAQAIAVTEATVDPDDDEEVQP